MIFINDDIPIWMDFLSSSNIFCCQIDHISKINCPFFPQECVIGFHQRANDHLKGSISFSEKWLLRGHSVVLQRTQIIYLMPLRLEQCDKGGQSLINSEKYRSLCFSYTLSKISVKSGSLYLTPFFFNRESRYSRSLLSLDR